MSLLDALLLDPQRIDVWLSPRNDGAVGTGTQTDPLDTSPQLATKLPINLSSGLTYTGTEANAAVTNTYSNNDIVVITGAADPAFNGIFVIYNVSSSAFKYHMDSVPAVTGGLAGSAQKVLELRFDTVMRTLVGPNTCVHVGPGVIPTRGYYEGIVAATSWQLQAGIRVSGSGIDVTKVKLLATAPAGNRCYAFGHDLIAASKPNLVEHAIIDVEDLARCIEKLYRNSELREQYAVAGRQFAESLSWDLLIPQWLDVLSQATGKTFAMTL